MTNTTNYNLLLAEGTDLVNYLTQTNPNFSTLDTVIKGVSDLTVTPATEVTTGTAHAISKTLTDATVIKFTATSNWLTGDTMTLDGSPVTPLKTDGTTLKTGDYIIGSAVLMIQDGTRVTVLVASSPDAGDINYDNTVSGLTSNKVQGAIDENAAAINSINSNLSPDYFGVNAGMDFTISSQTCFRIGKLCILQFTWDGTLTTAGDVIASVPNDHLPDINAPLTVFRGSCGYFKNGVAVGTGVIALNKTTGQITQGFTANPANVNSGRATIMYSMA